MILKAGTASDITLPVALLAGTGLKLAGSIYVLIYDQAQNKYFSTDGGGTWEARANATFPVATLITGGELYYYLIPASVSLGLADHTRLSLVLVDSTTPASVLAMSPTVLLEVLTDWPAEIGAAMAVPTDQAVNVTKWDGHAVIAHTVEGAPVVTVKVGTGAATGEINVASGVVPASVSGGATATNVSDAVTSIKGSGAPDLAAVVTAVGTRAAPADVTSAVTAVNGHTDTATTGLATGLSTIATNLDGKISEIDETETAALLDHALAGHTTAGTAGAALAALLNGAGSRQITLQVRAGVLAVPTCKIGIYDSANAVCAGEVTTDVNGNVIIGLADGAYKLRPVKAGYTFTTPQALTVTADATVAIAATAFVAPIPSAPTMCAVYGTLLDAHSAVLAGHTIRFAAVVPGAANGCSLVDPPVEVVTGIAGTFTYELQRGATVQIWAPAAGKNGESFLVPAAASQDFSTWSPIA